MPFSLPARTCGSEDGMLSKNSSTLPASRSARPGALPSDGRWLVSCPIDFISSYSRCESVPLPCEANATLPPCDFSQASSSVTLAAGTDDARPGCAARWPPG